MPPTIHLVRHAQGYHNLSVENESIHDPDLTPLGEAQCADLRASFPHHAAVTRLVASPMRRTLYTCIHGFGTAPLYPIAALDVLQEVSSAPCDTGSDVAKLAAEFGDRGSWEGVREGWTDKGAGSVFEPTVEKLTARAREGRRRLREIAGNGDEHIVAVTHGGFLHFLTDDFQDIPEERATGWANCEYRSYQFVDPTGQDDDAALEETHESWTRRRGDEKPLTVTERRQARALTEKRVAPFLKLVG